MKKQFSLTLIATVLFLISGSAAMAQNGGKAEPKRIEFRRGTHSAITSGVVRGDEQAEYVFSARKGQKLTIHLTSVPRRSAVFDLHAPDNADLGLQYDANYEYLGTVPATGDYSLSVSRPTQSRGKSRYRLSVSIR